MPGSPLRRGLVSRTCRARVAGDRGPPPHCLLPLPSRPRMSGAAERLQLGVAPPLLEGVSLCADLVCVPGCASWVQAPRGWSPSLPHCSSDPFVEPAEPQPGKPTVHCLISSEPGEALGRVQGVLRAAPPPPPHCFLPQLLLCPSGGWQECQGRGQAGLRESLKGGSPKGWTGRKAPGKWAEHAWRWGGGAAGCWGCSSRGDPISASLPLAKSSRGLRASVSWVRV